MVPKCYQAGGSHGEIGAGAGPYGARGGADPGATWPNIVRLGEIMTPVADCQVAAPAM